MKLTCAIFLFLITAGFAKNCPNKKTQPKLFCYYGKITEIDSCQCTHIILPADSDIKSIDRLKNTLSDTKILITVHEFNEVKYKFLLYFVP